MFLVAPCEVRARLIPDSCDQSLIQMCRMTRGKGLLILATSLASMRLLLLRSKDDSQRSPPLRSTNGHPFLPGATEHCSINKRCRRPSTWSTPLSTLCRWPLTCLTPSPEKGGRSAGRKCNSPNVVPHPLHWMLTEKGKKGSCRAYPLRARVFDLEL